MAKKCRDKATATHKYVSELSDEEILRGLKSHHDPEWWKHRHIKEENAYLRYWGSCLRREARRRGLTF